jgi:predicted N-acetyltransferase YhbS
MQIFDEQPQDAALIDALLETSFGSDRLNKTVYRFRDGVAPVKDLSLVAKTEEGEFRGTLRFWPVEITVAGGQTVQVLLLGPIAVDGGLRKTGVGTLLMIEGLARAKAQGWPAVLLVGDEPYYSRFGFQRALTLGLTLPGPVDENRFLGLEFEPGLLAGASGVVRRANA